MIEHLGEKCVRCGTKQNLEIDHIDRTKKTMEPARMAHVSAARRMEELKNCQLLCGSCHTKKTVTEDLGREFTRHGTYLMYVNKKCRCDSCREAMREYNRDLRRRKGMKPNKKAVHGTKSMYSYHKCRCGPCKAANTERVRAYRARKRKEKTS